MQAAAFLDRDGVINFDHGYVYRQSEFVFIPGVFDAARRLCQLGYAIVAVTNQSGIGRGIYSAEDFLALDDWMRQRFREEGAEIVATYYCPHHPSEATGRYLLACNCRKPRPGMLLQAAADHGLALERSLLVGDKPSDLQAALAAGIPLRLLVGTNGQSLPPELEQPGLATARYRSLADAVAAMEATGVRHSAGMK